MLDQEFREKLLPLLNSLSEEKLQELLAIIKKELGEGSSNVNG